MGRQPGLGKATSIQLFGQVIEVDRSLLLGYLPDDPSTKIDRQFVDVAR